MVANVTYLVPFKGQHQKRNKCPQVKQKFFCFSIWFLVWPFAAEKPENSSVLAFNISKKLIKKVKNWCEKKKLCKELPDCIFTGFLGTSAYQLHIACGFSCHHLTIPKGGVTAAH